MIHAGGATDLVSPRHVNISSRHEPHGDGSKKCSGKRSDCRLDVDEIDFGSLICLRMSGARRQYLRFWKRPMWDGELEKTIGRMGVRALWRRTVMVWIWVARKS